ncbi:MAG: trigger factor [candidate division NC10 bacterium]|nr:trigger factor [candidate division NC10 bacterium]
MRVKICRAAYGSPAIDGVRMKVLVEELSPNKRALSVEVATEQVEPKLEEAYREWSQRAAIPGFRKGKIPRSLLQLHFRKEIEDRVIREIIPKASLEAIKEADIRVVGAPEVDQVSLEPDHCLRFRLTVEVKPHLEVKDYLGVEVLRKPVQVTDEEVERALQVLQDRASQFVPMEGWPALEGDLVYVDLEGSVNKKAVKDLSREDLPVILGSHTLLPELEMALFEMGKGESKELEVTLPPSFIKREIAGKKAHFRLRVKEIKKKRVPELNEEFPKEIGEEGTLDDLRKKLRNELMAEKEKERDHSLKEEILEKIAEANPFEPPSSLVEEELERMMENALESLSARGATLKDLDLDEASLRERLRDQAEKRIKKSLILEAIAGKENIEPSEEDIQKELDDLSAALKQDPTVLRRYFEERDGLTQVRRLLRERKTLDFLFERANIISGDRIVLA